jgi:drug/metabolite transporter (DMT)-like permease
VRERSVAAARGVGGRAGSADALLVGAAAAWGASFAAAKPLVAFIEPAFVSGVRYLAVALLLIAWLGATRQPVAVRRGELAQLAALGVFGFGLFQGLWGFGLAYTTAAKSAILMATSPIFGVLFARLRGEPAGAAAWIGVLTAFGGVFLLMNGSLTEFRLGGGTLLGDAIWLVNGALWALFSLLSRPLVAKLGAARTTAWAALFGSGLLALVTAPFAAQDDWSQLRPAHLWNAAFLTLVAGAFAQIAYYRGLACLGLGRAIAYMYLVPIFGVAAALLALGEPFGAVQGLGAALTLAGVVIAQRALSRASAGG